MLVVRLEKRSAIEDAGYMIRSNTIKKDAKECRQEGGVQLTCNAPSFKDVLKFDRVNKQEETAC